MVQRGPGSPRPLAKKKKKLNRVHLKIRFYKMICDTGSIPSRSGAPLSCRTGQVKKQEKGKEEGIC